MAKAKQQNPKKPTNKQPTRSAARKDRPVYRIMLLCKKSENKLTTVENVNKPSFKCPLCEATLVYLPDQHKIGEHGVVDGHEKHVLRKAVEANTATSS
jgi:transcription initiation factor IIE alpha subunit